MLQAAAVFLVPAPLLRGQASPRSRAECLPAACCRPATGLHAARWAGPAGAVRPPLAFGVIDHTLSRQLPWVPAPSPGESRLCPEQACPDPTSLSSGQRPEPGPRTAPPLLHTGHLLLLRSPSPAGWLRLTASRSLRPGHPLRLPHSWLPSPEGKAGGGKSSVLSAPAGTCPSRSRQHSAVPRGRRGHAVRSHALHAHAHMRAHASTMHT